jgi:hypothetical protein
VTAWLTIAQVNKGTFAGSQVSSATVAMQQVYDYDLSIPVNSLTGTLTYSPGGVSTTNPLRVFAVDPGAGIGYLGSTTTNGGTYSMTGMETQSYGLVAWYDSVGAGNLYPQVGDYFSILGALDCIESDGTSVAVSGATVQNMTFSNSNQFYGVAGTITYNGSKGTVSSSNPMQVYFYEPGTLTAHGTSGANAWGWLTNNASVTANGVRYDTYSYNSGNGWCAAFNVDVCAWYRAPSTSGGGSIPGTGMPFIILSNVTTSALANQNITFDDTNLW